ncbi:MAG: hypothetical protein FJY54_16220 [Betaproteobacteria bacterium]|nr:hypothetical protein [Betaproteobacteria bacterium]
MKQVVDYIQSFIVVGLVLFGIAGLSYHSFRDEGWIESALGDIWELHVQYPLIAVPVTVGACILAKMWHEQRLSSGRLSKLPDIFIYALMAAGAYFFSLFVYFGEF